MDDPEAKSKAEKETHESAINHIRDALRGLRFGALNIVVQDGVVVQIDRTEKRRLTRPNSGPK